MVVHGAAGRTSSRVWNGLGCLASYRAFDRKEAARDVEPPQERERRRAIYGIDREDLGGAGPHLPHESHPLTSVVQPEA